MTIKQRLIAASICSAVAIAALGGFGNWSLSKMTQVMNAAAETSLVEIDHTNSASRAVSKIYLLIDGFIDASKTGRGSEADGLRREIDALFGEVASDLVWLRSEAEAQLAVRGTPEERDHESKQLHSVQQINDTLHWLRVEWSALPPWGTIETINYEKLRASTDKAMQAAIIRLLDMEDGAQNEAQEELRQTVRSTAWIRRAFMIISAAALFAAVAIGWSVSQSLSRRLRRATEKTTELGRGDLTVRIEDTRRDELGQLAQAFNTMAQRLSLSQTQLAGAIAAAEAANRAKSEFLANMSHEIRTPMTAILGYNDLIADASLPSEERAEHVRTVRRNGEHLLSVINDILDLSKIEAERMEVESLACSPCQVVAEIAATTRVRAAGKNLSLNVVYAFPVPGTILTDGVRLRQILLNLVGNAIKFTEHGGVRIAVRSDGQSQATPKIHFDIIDTGIGIDPEAAQRLFQPFSQADTSMVRRFGGTGLGLTISRRLARIMGGDITVESSTGHGSRFTLTIPTGALDGVKMINDPHEAIASTEPAPNTPSLPKDCCRGRILLAEDGPDNQRLIAFHLKRAGADVTIVENGDLALSAVAEARDQGAPFDLILMDMQMPVLDGYAATTLARQRGFAGPIVALTAHAMPEDRAKCLASGCSDYLTKPIANHHLIAAVAKHLNRGSSKLPIQERAA